MSNKVTYQVQDWMGKVLFETDSLAFADDFKYSLSDDEQELEDYYIVGIDENGNEFAPSW